MISCQVRINQYSLGIILLIVLDGIVSGCASAPPLPTFSALKELPGFDRGSISKKDVVFDPAIRVYRKKVSNGGSEEMTGIVLRDAFGKKIQSEEELSRAIKSINRETIGGGTKAAAYGLTGVYTPVTFAETIINYVFGFPIYWIINNNNKEDTRRAEEAYISGRRYFDSQKFEAALGDWKRAEILFPELHLNSDIDYWRGRALEALGENESARTAYLTFLNYSERSIPSDFKDLYPNDPAWAEKADDAERRLYGVQAGL
jgi:tetratricopeptide (TPR) repeat protein